MSVATMWLFVSRLALSAGTVHRRRRAFLIFSKAFVDYSTSGLENPLTHLLLAIFFTLYWNPERATSDDLWLVAALIMLNRLDAGLLVLPALLHRSYEVGWKNGC